MKKALLIFLLALVACTTNQPTDGTAIDDATAELHQSIHTNEALYKQNDQKSHRGISKALVPGMRLRSPERNFLQRRFDIAVKDVPARTFYTGLVEGTPVSIVVSPEITGNITLNLKQVTLEQVLQTLESAYGYSYNPIASGFEILPNTLKTQIYSVNYLELERKGRSSITLSSGEVTQSTGGSGSGGGVTGSSSSSSGSGGIGGGNGVNNLANVIGNIETKSTTDFWKQLALTLTNIIGTEGGRSVTVNTLAGVVVVRATPKEQKQVEAYLDLIQNSMDRQVILEAKIIEVQLNDQYQMGIDWKIFGATLNSINTFPNTDIRLDDFPNAYNIAIKWSSDFTTTIRALETQGNVQVLSSPRVAAMNNQASAIKVGTDEFFVTNVTSTPNVTTAGVLAGSTPNVNLSPFFSGITLGVTPQIDTRGDVTLHIHPSISDVKDQNKAIDLGTQGGVLILPLAKSDIRESDTVVHAKNGQVIVLGGLMENQTREDVAQLPFFGNIPFLGTLLRATKQTSRKSELVILLKPTVLTPKNTNKKIIESTQQIQRLKRGFHIGGRPDIFGTEGEEPVSFGPPAGYYSQPRH